MAYRVHLPLLPSNENSYQIKLFLFIATCSCVIAKMLQGVHDMLLLALIYTCLLSHGLCDLKNNLC